MWPSERLASISLDSWQGVAQTRRRDQRGIRPIVTLLEGRALLSTVPITVTGRRFTHGLLRAIICIVRGTRVSWQALGAEGG